MKIRFKLNHLFKRSIDLQEGTRSHGMRFLGVLGSFVLLIGAIAVFKGVMSDSSVVPTPSSPSESSENSTSSPTVKKRAPASDSSSEEEPLYEPEDLEEIETQLAMRWSQSHTEGLDVEKPKEKTFSQLWNQYKNLFKRIHQKIQSLRSLEEEVNQLRAENAELKLQLEAKLYEQRVNESKKYAYETGQVLKEKTGSPIGRTLASIQYQIPENLMSDQTLALGLSHFKVRDYEKAAKTLGTLTHLDYSKKYQTPSLFLLTGISFYKMDNFQEAGEFFDQALHAAVLEGNGKIQRQAQVWKAIAYQRENQIFESQKILNQITDQSPQSFESQLINSVKKQRVGE